jgi:phage anti-repressor protein
MSAIEIEIDIKLQDMLNLEFTNEEQQIFLQHFKGFLNKDDEFIINIEFVFKWIGFARKDHAKRLLEKYFIIDSDYKITLNSLISPPKGENLKLDIKKEGRPVEVILLTPNCFKQLCLLANTDKGKQVRLYYIKMESVLMKYLKEKNEINEKLLLDSMQMNKNLDYALQTEQKKIARILSRRVNKEEPGQLVYIYKESEFKYKIGETINNKCYSIYY